MSLAKALGVPVRRRPPITTRYDNVAPQVNIRGIPTAIVFARGAEFGRQTGAVPKQVLEELLTKAVA